MFVTLTSFLVLSCAFTTLGSLLSSDERAWITLVSIAGLPVTGLPFLKKQVLRVLFGTRDMMESRQGSDSEGERSLSVTSSKKETKVQIQWTTQGPDSSNPPLVPVLGVIKCGKVYDIARWAKRRQCAS